jgi:hypothetical protein
MKVQRHDRPESGITTAEYAVGISYGSVNPYPLVGAAKGV